MGKSKLSLSDAIKHYEEVAERLEGKDGYAYTDSSCDECAKEHRQLAEWLREVEESRKVIDVFLQTFIDFDLDICCEDLVDDDDEVCMGNCNNKTKDCWLRWAKLKAREGSDSE